MQEVVDVVLQVVVTEEQRHVEVDVTCVRQDVVQVIVVVVEQDVVYVFEVDVEIV